MKTTPLVSIIILSYNTRDLTLACLSSVTAMSEKAFSYEVILVDNASKDDTVQMVHKQFPDVVIVQNQNNVGFAAGNNIGIQKANGRYILLLNSDTQVSRETIPAMVAFMESHKRAGVATCKLLLSDGTMDQACHRGFPTPWAAFTYMVGLERLFPQTTVFGAYHQGYKPIDTPHEIDCPSGAFFLVRRQVLKDVGLLDEDYFMYGEDIDWAYRIKEKGWQIWFNPEVTITHFKKQSGRKHANTEIIKHANASFYETMKLFYKKHYEHKYPFLLTAIIYAMLDIRIGLAKVNRK